MGAGAKKSDDILLLHRKNNFRRQWNTHRLSVSQGFYIPPNNPSKVKVTSCKHVQRYKKN